MHPFRNSLPVELDHNRNTLLQDTLLLLPQFQNKDGEASFNFWTTRPSGHFPNGLFAHRFRFFQIPDDTDDSCLAYLTLPLAKSDSLLLLEKLRRYANGQIRYNKSLPEDLQRIPAYNTFFIKNMPSNMDAVVLCNALYWLMEAQHQPGLHEEACLDFVRLCVKKKYWLTQAARIAAYYPRPALFAYHFSRLVERFPSLFTEEVTDTFRKQLEGYETNAASIYAHDRLLVELSRCRMNMPFQKDLRPGRHDAAQYPFYVAGLCGEFHLLPLQKLNRFSIAQIQYRSAVFSGFLELEYNLRTQQPQAG